ncbi:hypothetical protein BC629DRAFT_1526540 [Irpex lacteus]|nr:hypothetical protein BC629DRAFT_1526540 [Irpex lacteus]
MLWWTAGGDLSQIPSQHPQLLRVAHISSDERYVILDKGYRMAEAYRRSPGNLPGIEDENGDGVECTGTSAPPQGIQNPIPNDLRADADELGVAGGSQPEYMYGIIGYFPVRV